MEDTLEYLDPLSDKQKETIFDVSIEHADEKHINEDFGVGTYQKIMKDANEFKYGLTVEDFDRILKELH
jgi:hypothetical protein